MKIHMVSSIRLHSTLQTTETGDQEFCAESFCRGQCGYPALFLREVVPAGSHGASVDEEGRHYYDYKAHGSVVSCGPVWQKKEWDGERVYLAFDADRIEKMIDKMWW